MRVDASTLGVDEASKVFVEEKVRILVERFGRGDFLGDELGIVLLVNVELLA